MDADSIQVRLMARGVAVLGALSVATLLSTLRIPPLAEPGEAQSRSIDIVRARDLDMARAAFDALEAEKGPAPVTPVADALAGQGEETRLWVEGPGGALLFANEDRYRRCVRARQRGIDEADCPSAGDPRPIAFAREARGV